MLINFIKKNSKFDNRLASISLLSKVGIKNNQYLFGIQTTNNPEKNFGFLNTKKASNGPNYTASTD